MPLWALIPRSDSTLKSLSSACDEFSVRNDAVTYVGRLQLVVEYWDLSVVLWRDAEVVAADVRRPYNEISDAF